MISIENFDQAYCVFKNTWDFWKNIKSALRGWLFSSDENNVLVIKLGNEWILRLNFQCVNTGYP